MKGDPKDLEEARKQEEDPEMSDEDREAEDLLGKYDSEWFT